MLRQTLRTGVAADVVSDASGLSCILPELRAGTAKMPACCAPGYNNKYLHKPGPSVFRLSLLVALVKRPRAVLLAGMKLAEDEKKMPRAGVAFFWTSFFFPAATQVFIFRSSDLPCVSHHPLGKRNGLAELLFGRCAKVSAGTQRLIRDRGC